MQAFRYTGFTGGRAGVACFNAFFEQNHVVHGGGGLFQLISMRKACHDLSATFSFDTWRDPQNNGMIFCFQQMYSTMEVHPSFYNEGVV
jgi:hypothetical protein